MSDPGTYTPGYQPADRAPGYQPVPGGAPGYEPAPGYGPAPGYQPPSGTEGYQPPSGTPGPAPSSGASAAGTANSAATAPAPTAPPPTAPPPTAPARTEPAPSSGADLAGDRSGEDVSEMSLGQLVSKVTEDLSTLMRQEIELAKAEVTSEAKKAGKGAGMLGGAGYAGHLTVLFLSFAAWWALANVMPIGWAAFIVAVIWGAIAAVLALTGKKKLQEVRPKPERTIDTIREVPSALKG